MRLVVSIHSHTVSTPVQATTMPVFKEKSDYEKPSAEHEEYIEDGERKGSIADQVTELSSIEDTAASKAAWLISVTVSLGGFLFG